MTTRSEALFLWNWTQRRKRGRLGVIKQGALVGAVGGFVFAGAMLAAMSGSNISFNADEMSPWVLAFAEAVGPAAFMFILAVPAFAFGGVFVAHRAFNLMEREYYRLLDQGAVVPATKPQTSLADHAPRLILLGVVLVVVVGLLVFAWLEINRGGL